MELIALFFESLGVGFSGAMMPGPLLAVDIAETPRSGWQTGPIISIGHAIAEVFVVVVLSLGIAALLKNGFAARVIAVVGGVALLLMGGMMVWDTLKGKVQYRAESPDERSNHQLAGKGITATLSNPYWFVWWATVGLAYLVKSQAYGWVGPVVFYFGHIMSDFVWYTVVSLILWRGRSLMMGRGLKVLLLTCAAFLLYLGGRFIADGITGEILL